ncbi:hypothetical protein Btru_063653 [Bulinus truncatus]|nr:hypothetical protein Btru_063653 [Bulinus truncatus]
MGKCTTTAYDVIAYPDVDCRLEVSGRQNSKTNPPLDVTASFYNWQSTGGQGSRVNNDYFTLFQHNTKIHHEYDNSNILSTTS